MPCYKPLTGWYSKDINPTGKRSIVFNPKRALQQDDPIEIPCSQCIGCRLERSRQWAMRCMHESQMREDNMFITLTFDSENLHKRENPYGLDKKEFQKFMKRLRKWNHDYNVPNYVKSIKRKLTDLLESAEEETKERILKRIKKLMDPYSVKYYMCGEYGDKTARPHYHAIIFGLDFKDKELYKIENGQRLYNSVILSKLWPYGFAVIGSVTFESAAYVSRYIMKKQTGEVAQEHYTCMHPETGEILEKIPEYNAMSLKMPIGKTWYEEFKDDVYPKDYVTVNGKKMRPPKYYDKLHKIERPYEFDDIKEQRKLNAEKHSENNTYERLLVREKVQHSKLNKLTRSVD